MPTDSQDVQNSRFERFVSLFPVRTVTKFRRPESTAWRSMSQFHSLSDDEIFDSLQNEANFIRSCPIGSSTRFAVLGIPANSIYSNPRRISVIIDLLKNVGLSPVLYGSPSCDEIQIYLFFSELQKTKLINQALTSLLVDCGLQVNAENLIVYAEDQDLQLPLQQGFSWLTDSLMPKVCRNEIAFESALAMFMADIAKSSTQVDQLLNFQAGLQCSVDEILQEKQEDFTPPVDKSKLINQEPQKPSISIIEDACDNSLTDQSGSIDQVLIIQVDQAQTSGYESELVAEPEVEKKKALVGSRKDSKINANANQFAQLKLPLLSDQIAKTKSSKKRRSKDRRSKRGPPDQ